MKTSKNSLINLGAGLVLMASATTADAVAVNAELLLLADVSGSLDANDFALQRDGYVAAFQSASVQSAIASLSGGIAVSLGYWSTGQTQSVGWTHVTDAASANAFAALIAGASRPSSGSTYMTNALTWGTGLFAGNGFEGDRQIIDLSGDGYDTGCGAVTSCVPLQNARDAAITAGVDSINAIWIEDEAQPSSRDFFCLDASCFVNPLDYGTANVIAGANNFQMVVSNFDDFAAAVETKIGRELVPVPEPATLAIMALGLAGIGFRRKLVG